MSRDPRKIFGYIDQMDGENFVGSLTPDVRFRFGNGDPAIGSDAVRDAVNGFWASIKGLQHHLQEMWDVSEDITVARIDVEYIRHDDKHVTVPNLDILRWRGEKVEDWQIYIDLAPVFA